MIADFFKSIKLYVKLYSNKIEITNLDNEQSICKNAANNFSTSRIVVSNFHNAHMLMQEILKELGVRKRFRTIKIVIQQMEKMEGGLSDIEKRAILDLAEQSGSIRTIILEHSNSLSIEQDKLELK